MTFRVIWLDRVIRGAAKLYVDLRDNDGDADAITRAMAAIDKNLERALLYVGESRADLTRILIEPPLTIQYEVHEEHRVVIVTSVRYATRGGKPPKGTDQSF